PRGGAGERLMNPRDGIRLAFSQIRAQKLKSFFAIVGVIIGVMFLITVVSVVEGMNRYMEEDFAQTIYGINTLTVRRTPQVDMSSDPDTWRAYARRPRLRFEDADAIREGLTVNALVGVSSMSGASIVSETGTEVSNVFIVSASAEIFRIRN